jgi:circadian clock protein KaiC
MGGGLPCGSNTLLCGPSGVGKTTTAIACVLAALKRGERAVYYLFDEGLGTLTVRARALGLDITPYLESGHLKVMVLDPAEVSAGEFAHMVRHAVEVDGVQVVSIDSLNAYLQAMPGSKYLMLQMHELLTYLDGILLFRFFEAHGQVLKALSMVKSRTNQHEPTIREFRLRSQGIEIGPALTDFVGVLAGVATYRGRMALLGDTDPLRAE